MHIVAGCDGGGTKCAVRVAQVAGPNEPSKLSTCGSGFAGGANVATNLETAIANITNATHAALSDLGLATDTRIEHFVAALAGSTRVDEPSLIAELKSQLNANKVSVVPDVAVLFAAAKFTPPAIATVVGTGSIAWLQSNSGSVFRSGGEGPVHGDFGSGHWIGKAAVDAGLMEAHALDATSGEVSTFARLAPTVFSMAKDSMVNEDRRELAAKILEQAGQHIANLVIDVAQQWKQESRGADIVRLPWVVAGGVAVHQASWVRSIHAHCEAAEVALGEPRLIKNPVEGALKMAAKF